MSFQHLSLQSDGSDPRKWLNRRATVRYQCAPATVGKVFAPSQEEFRRIWILDLSKGGAGVLLSRSIPLNQGITVQITSPSGLQKFEFQAKVAHISEKVTGEFVAGLEFVRPLTPEELDSILE